MIKTLEILSVNLFSIICKFNTGEIKVLEMDKVLSTTDKYSKQILDPTKIKLVKIGEFGQLYWENMAEMRDIDGKMIPCEYDLSPEFVYANSSPIP